jgi:UDP-N-acetylmuramoylalanine--D-glutamate ligase
VKGSRVLIIGMGKSGKAVIDAALAEGAIVSAMDSKAPGQLDADFIDYLNKNGVRQYFGIRPDNMSDFDMLILSPGVPPTLDYILEAEESGAEIIGELELAYRLSKGSFIAITGTNGKTTTTTLAGEIFKAAGRDTNVAGNIGVAVVTGARDSNEDTVLVTEVSSFQLETVKRFRPVVSAILNLTPDHMDRHKTMENYGRAKAAIFANQTEEQFCILNYDDKACYELAEREGCNARVVPFSRFEELEFGAFVKDGNIVIRDDTGKDRVICGTNELKIPGSHNLENALAAAAITWVTGIDADVIGKAMREFSGVSHRIELCCEIDGVRFVNDSKGTNPDAAIKAIEAMKENIILIAGGYDKGSSYDKFVASFPGRVKALILMGVTAKKIRDAAEAAGFTNIFDAGNMGECVAQAKEMAEAGDVVLLSPACASWGMYNNFEERGEDFKSWVRKLG